MNGMREYTKQKHIIAHAYIRSLHIKSRMGKKWMITVCFYDNGIAVSDVAVGGGGAALPYQMTMNNKRMAGKSK